MKRVIFKHDLDAAFFATAKYKDWVCVSKIIEAIYKIDSSPYTDPLLDLCTELRKQFPFDVSKGLFFNINYNHREQIITVDLLEYEKRKVHDVMEITAYIKTDA